MAHRSSWRFDHDDPAGYRGGAVIADSIAEGRDDIVTDGPRRVRGPVREHRTPRAQSDFGCETSCASSALVESEAGALLSRVVSSTFRAPGSRHPDRVPLAGVPVLVRRLRGVLPKTGLLR